MASCLGYGPTFNENATSVMCFPSVQSSVYKLTMHMWDYCLYRCCR